MQMRSCYLCFGNSFSGPIPKSIADVYRLFLLDLSKNKFSGKTIPVFDPDGFLSYIDLSSNELSGDIPVSFCRETKTLKLGGNKFSGNLPRNLTFMNQLQHLDLHDNSITGKLPEFLSQISTLQVLNLRNNSLHGSIPYNSFSSKSSLKILHLSNNNLVGGIPSELGNLKGMIEIPPTSSIATDRITSLSELWESIVHSEMPSHIKVNWKKVFQDLSGHSFGIY